MIQCHTMDYDSRVDFSNEIGLHTSEEDGRRGVDRHESGLRIYGCEQAMDDETEEYATRSAAKKESRIE
jgi:hypothetical protein